MTRAQSSERSDAAAAIWTVEDGFPVGSGNRYIALATAIGVMLGEVPTAA